MVFSAFNFFYEVSHVIHLFYKKIMKVTKCYLITLKLNIAVFNVGFQAGLKTLIYFFFTLISD